MVGNHRAVVEVSAQTEAVRVLLPWRRADVLPESKRVVVKDADECIKSVTPFIGGKGGGGDAAKLPEVLDAAKDTSNNKPFRLYFNAESVKMRAV
ncbi:hypothetical protein FACS1894170_05960 [Planctomycetales bacterium]|nr:hypothetical protein FACS1894170_05960 [Planctomycetales bacterium]